MRITDGMREAVAAVLEENGLLVDDAEPDQIIAAVAPLIRADLVAENERLRAALRELNDADNMDEVIGILAALPHP